MIRILVIDDIEQPEFINDMAREVSDGFGEEVDIVHMNPVATFKGGDHQNEISLFLEHLRDRASEFWDAAIIDIHLHEVNLPKEERLHLSLRIAEVFREVNHAAIAILYSGTLEEHVKKLLGGDTPAEPALKKIFRAEIAAFVPRRTIGLEVLSALDRPPSLLRVDRLLTKNASCLVGVEESEFKGKSFAELATAVRRQNGLGRRVSDLVTEFGVASLLDLNK